MKKTSDALWNIRAAMLFFLIDINIFGFDIIPDFVGWLCMLEAIHILEGTIPSIERIRSFGKALLWYELALVVLNYIGGSIPFTDQILPFVVVLLLCIRIYFMYIILTAIADAGQMQGGEAITLKKLRRDRNVVLLAEVAVYLAAAVQGTEEISGWLWMPTAIYFLSYIRCIIHLTYLKEEVEKWETDGIDPTKISEA